MKTQLKVKRYTLLATLIAMFSLNGYAQDTQTPTKTKTFELTEPGTLNAASSGGGIKVLTHDKGQVVVQLFVRNKGKLLAPSDPLVDNILANYVLVIEKNGTVITATAKQKPDIRPWRNGGVGFTIIVPEKMSCNVSSSGGGLRISGVSGMHHFKSSGGSVRLENTVGTTKAKSSGGKVEVTNHQGDINLSSSGGSVLVNGAQGAIYAHSSGGSVRLNNVHGHVDVSSSGGGVRVNGACNYLKATSSGGRVRVNISALSKELYLKSSGGGIDAIIQNGDKLGLDLDLRSVKVNIDLKNFSGHSEKNRVKGAMNEGGIPVYIHSSGGNINVKFQE